MIRPIAFYLPQYHETPENDMWWGKGYTEWVNLRKAKPLFEGHYQPREPLEKNYYDLLDTQTKRWQCQLARKYGIYGFCFYHYWFDGHLMLHQPVEQYLTDKECFLPFCICWANENWTRAWNSAENKILIEQTYGDERTWEKHFYYLLPFLKDERYICENNKPLLLIYKPGLIKRLSEMLSYWLELAVQNGLPGLCFAAQDISSKYLSDRDKSFFDHFIEYQPQAGMAQMDKRCIRGMKEIKRRIDYNIRRLGLKTINLHKAGNITGKPTLLNYNKVWEAILKSEPSDRKTVAGAFVDWDNSPRRDKYATIMLGATPERFEYYMRRLCDKVRREYETDMIFLFAWNEWTEGGYLEPDERYGYAYLQALQNALIWTE